MNGRPWGVDFSRLARKDIGRLDPPVRQRVYEALNELANNRPTVKERKLADKDEWRIRVGDWRIRFTRDTKLRTIVVQRILPRGRAYDR